MYQLKKNFILFILFFCYSFLYAQNNIPIQTWRVHANYQSAKKILLTNSRAYVQVKNGLFYLPFDENLTYNLSKNDGLSEGIIAATGFDNQKNAILIAYQNGTLDWLKDGKIVVNTLIKDLSITQSKSINDIYFHQKKAYICTDFGVVIWDSERQMIVDTYQNLGIAGINLKINSATISKDSLVLATERGVMIGALSNNLKDFNQWKRFTNLNGISSNNTKKIVSFNGKIYAIQNNNLLYRYTHLDNNAWTTIALGTIPLENISQNQNFITINNQNQIVRAGLDEIFTTISNALFVDLQDAKSDMNGKIFAADSQNGLITNKNNVFEKYFPNSPANLPTQRIYFGNQQIAVSSGGFDANLTAKNQQLGFYIFDENGLWKNYNHYDALNAQTIPLMNDIVDIFYAETDKSWYFTSFADGVLVKKNDNTFTIFNTLTTGTSFRNDITGKLRITGVAGDRNGDIWFTQYQPNTNLPYLHVKRNNNTWQGFSSNQPESRQITDIFIDRNGFKWMKIATGGLWVFDDKTNRSRLLTMGAGNGGLPDNVVNSITQDKEGQIWIGTNRGVATLFNSGRIFDLNTNFFTPIFSTRPLLRSEIVTNITIDGGNRKWIGTKNGLWLFNADGTQNISYFNTENSPMFDNSIVDLALHAQTGELFILNEGGIVSYRTDATESTENFGDIKIFPNPVRPDYYGEVGISGLAENSFIKITDSAGRLFFETKANGGTTAWNLRDYQGTQAETGVYLIFATKTDGSQTLVGKIALVR